MMHGIVFSISVAFAVWFIFEFLLKIKTSSTGLLIGLGVALMSNGVYWLCSRSGWLW